MVVRLFLALVIFPCISCLAGNIYDTATLRNWGNTLGTESNQFVRSVIGIDEVNKEYNASLSRVTFHNVDASVEVKRMANTLGTKEFEPKVKALKDSVTAAEKLASNYTWNPSLKKEDVDYIYAKDDSLDSINSTVLAYDPLFNQRINMTRSSVHIPVEIYAGNVHILNSVQWSGGLENIWAENRKNNPKLLWQYFGSQDGFIRTHPASKWKRPKVDLYDVRRRPWYTSGSSSPKDMIILMDTSGSTFGQALQLMKFAVKFLLDTIGENDYVSIISFSKEPQFVMDCLKTKLFLQANYWNKQDLYQAVQDNVHAKKMANYEAAFKFAFKQFRDFRRNATNGAGADCSKVIMLLSDGTTEKPEAVFRKYNSDQSVRVFTFAVGPTASDVSSLKWMACANKGYFSTIYALGAIMSKVQDYVAVVARVLAIENVQYLHWSAIYNDALSGLGMMTTLTLPVYNKSSDSSQSNQTILGVMGIDVSVKDLEMHTPYLRLGPNAYSFAIDSNGYIVFHPDLKALKGWLQDPPNVDLLHVEIPDSVKKEVRTSMIRGKGQNKTFDMMVLYDEERYVAVKKRTYYYTQISGTQFSLAIVVPDYDRNYVKIKGYDVSKSVEKLEATFNSSDSVVILAPWVCKSIKLNASIEKPDIDSNINMTKEEEDVDLNDPRTGLVLSHLKTQGSNHECDANLIQHLMWDINVLDTRKTHWTGIETMEMFKGKSSGWFVVTNSGLLQGFPASLRDRIKDLADVRSSEIYKRTMDSDPDTFIYSTPYRTGPNMRCTNESDSGPDVMVTNTVILKGFRAAVSGAMIKQEKLMELMNTASKGVCANSEEQHCHLLDEGGFIISTNQNCTSDKIGRWFGYVDNGAMTAAIQKWMYSVNERYDYQAACPKFKKSSSAGYRNYVPSLPLYEMLSVSWWSNKFAWAYLNVNLYSWLFGSPEDYGAMAVKSTRLDENKSCVLHQHQYYYNSSVQSFQDVIVCDMCNRTVTGARVNGTNMLLVITNPCNKEGCPVPATLEQKPKEDPNHTPTACDREHWFRERLKPCYSEDKREDASLCNAGRTVHNSAAVIYSIIVTILYMLSSSHG